LEDTDWRDILELYELLATRSTSPIVALNRSISVGQFKGPAAGLAALQSLSPQETVLAEYPFFHAAIGEFRYRNAEPASAVVAFEKALDLARSPAERNFFARKIRRIKQVAKGEDHHE
jgi:predicted RNA polymerase sigma factor